MTAVVLHEGYRRVEGGHDLALIRLETPVSLGSRAGIICLPKPRYPFAFGTPCWITGWGNVAENGENPRLGMGWVGGGPPAGGTRTPPGGGRGGRPPNPQPAPGGPAGLGGGTGRC